MKRRFHQRSDSPCRPENSIIHKKALSTVWSSRQGESPFIPGLDTRYHVMPRLIKSARAKPDSNSPTEPPPKVVPPSPQFTESQQSSPPQDPSLAESPPDPAEQLSTNEPPAGELSVGELSLDATEPFPPDLFRVPIPDIVFEEMPELSDSALRCLLALIHLSFRFEPKKSEWVCPDRQFSRSDVEEASGLSDQGARNGLSELESLGWADVDRSGHSHQHQLLLEVPDRRFTYVPTGLLREASDAGPGTELRVVLTVLRRIWGWTYRRDNPQNGEQSVVHDRWARLSTEALAGATGRSETAVRQAAQSLQGEWVRRVRPGNGPHQYRFLPEQTQDHLRDRPEENSSSSEGDANDPSPNRQKSDAPTFHKENSCRDKHRRQEENAGNPPDRALSPAGTDAVPANNTSRQPSASETTSETSNSSGKAPPPDLTGLPPEKRDLAEKLSNIGIWAGRIAEVLSRFSTECIRANFHLYRKRSAEQTIRKPGAWLYKAITDGCALPHSSSGEPEGSPNGSRPTAPGSLPALEHKDTVSEAKKDAYVAQGMSVERFHRCLSGRSGLDERQFMCFGPDVGGPDRRT